MRVEITEVRPADDRVGFVVDYTRTERGRRTSGSTFVPQGTPGMERLYRGAKVEIAGDYQGGLEIREPLGIVVAVMQALVRCA